MCLENYLDSQMKPQSFKIIMKKSIESKLLEYDSFKSIDPFERKELVNGIYLLHKKEIEKIKPKFNIYFNRNCFKEYKWDYFSSGVGKWRLIISLYYFRIIIRRKH